MKVNRMAVFLTTTLLMGACSGGHIKEDDYAGFISKDTANVMIESYLHSLGSDNEAKQEPQLYSLIMDAKELRTYLEDNPEIKNVKLMFAHTLDYIHAGNAGKPAGLSSKALTIIVAGYDREGNYIFAPGNRVADHCTPCPEFCPKFGTAASNLLK